MATPKRSLLDRSFRYLLHDIGTKLSSKNCRSLRFLYQINRELEEDEPGLDILQELQSQTVFNAMKPDQLEDDLTRIKRQDLANLVRQYKCTEEFKRTHPEEGKKVRRGGKSARSDELTYVDIVLTNGTSRQGQNEEDRSCHVLGITFMHVLQTVDQSRCLVDTMAKETEVLSKKKEIEAAIADARKDFESISKSLKKVITVIKQARTASTQTADYSVEETARPPPPPKKKPLSPPPKNNTSKMSLCHSISYTNISPMDKTLSPSWSEPNGISEVQTKSRTSSFSRSEEDIRLKAQYSYINTRGIHELQNRAPRQFSHEELPCFTGDSGYNDITWQSVLPNLQQQEDSKTSGEPREQLGDYEQLNQDTKDDAHDYTDFIVH